MHKVKKKPKKQWSRHAHYINLFFFFFCWLWRAGRGPKHAFFFPRPACHKQNIKSIHIWLCNVVYDAIKPQPTARPPPRASPPPPDTLHEPVTGAFNTGQEIQRAGSHICSPQPYPPSLYPLRPPCMAHTSTSRLVESERLSTTAHAALPPAYHRS